MKLPGIVSKALGLNVDVDSSTAAEPAKQRETEKASQANSNNSSSGTIREDLPDNMEGLSTRVAIQAHQAWSQRLRDYIDGKSSEQLDPEVVSCDDKCVLGKWIHGTALPKFGNLNEVEGLRDHHAQFHKIAGNIIRLHDDGQSSEAEQFLPALRNKSIDVQAAIGKLHKVIK